VKEHQYWIDNNLCLFCGKKGHWITDCLLVKASSSKRQSCHCYYSGLCPGDEKTIGNPPDTAQMEDCHSSTPCAETAVRLNAVVTSDSLSHPLICKQFDLSFLSFLNSGSTCSFIDEGYMAEHNLPAIPIPPILLRLIDRSMCPSITSALTLSIQFPCGTTHSIRYLVTQLDSEFPAVLGLDWLTQHNLLIDWVD